jgi:hypothetical protein
MSKLIISFIAAYVSATSLREAKVDAIKAPGQIPAKVEEHKYVDQKWVGEADKAIAATPT